jgi:membrane protein DedA with SNARE-associated domain
MQTISSFTTWINSYGGFALFFLLAIGIVGLPIPDETLMVFAGVLIAKGSLSAMPTFSAAFLGSVCGISLSYLLGRTAGQYLITNYGYYIGINKSKIIYVHNWFERIGKWTLFFGYFIPGVRHITGYVAGTTELQLKRFMLFAYSGAFIWVLTFLSLGFFFGDRWQDFLKFFQTMDRDIFYGLIVFSLTLLIFYLLWKNKKKD